MRKIAIINQKGGVGKTTTTISIAAGLARNNKKVLIIDLDPQGNIATCISETNDKGIFDYIINDTHLEHCITHIGVNLDLLTSKENLHKAEVMILKKENPTTFLKEKLSKIKGYDYILIDCAPSLGLLNQSILLFADEAIIPASTDILGFDALEKMLEAVEDINEYYDHNLKVTKIIPTQYDRRLKSARKILEEMSAKHFGKLTHPIRICSKIKEAPKHKKSIFSYAPNSRSAKDYAGLINLILHDEFEIVGEEAFERQLVSEVEV